MWSYWEKYLEKSKVNKKDCDSNEFEKIEFVEVCLFWCLKFFLMFVNIELVLFYRNDK